MSDNYSQFWSILRAQQKMLIPIVEAVHAGAIPDEVIYNHDILHAFSKDMEALTIDTNPELTLSEIKFIAPGILNDLNAIFTAYLDFEPNSDFVPDYEEYRGKLSRLFKELSPCIPKSVAAYQESIKQFSNWSSTNAEIVRVVQEELDKSELGPYEFFEILTTWLGNKSIAEQNELKTRLDTEDPYTLWKEMIHCALLAHSLEFPIEFQ